MRKAPLGAASKRVPALLLCLVFAPIGRAFAADVTPPADVTDLYVSSGAAAGSLKLTWSAPADDAHGGAIVGGFYRLDYSSDAAHVFSSGSYQLQLPTTTAPGRRETVLAGGLLGNATYYARVYAADDVPNVSGPSNAALGVTLAYPPSAPTHTGNTTAGVAWSWSDPLDQPDTEHYAEDGVGASGWTVSTTWASGGRTPNEQVQLSVRSRNRAGVETSAVSTTAYTSIEPPTGILFDMLGISSLTARVSGTFTGLAVGLSGVRLANDDVGTDSGWQKAVSWTPTPLFPNTFYSISARARNAEGDETPQTSAPACTQLAPPSASDLTLVADSSSQLTISVTTPFHPDQINTGSEFLYVDGYGGHGSGKLTGAYSFVNKDLTPNTRHGFQVRYYDSMDRPTDLSPAKYLWTPAVQPGFRSYSGDGEGRLRLNWEPYNNSGYTEYAAQLSTDGWATVTVSCRTYNDYTVFQGLPGQVYYSRVKAINSDGVSTDWTDLGFIVLIPPPTLPRHPGETTTSIDWAWTNAPDEPAFTPHYAWDETGASGWVLGTESWSSGGKSPNTLYTMRVKGVNAGGVETAAASTSAYTAIESPPGLAAVSVGLSSLTVTVLGALSHLESGASGVRVRDTVHGADSGWMKGATWTRSGFTPNTLFQFLVRARNGDGDETPDGAPLTAATAVPDPLDADPALTADSSTQLTVSATAPPNPALGATGADFVHVEGPGGSGSGFLLGTYVYRQAALTPNTRYAYKFRYFNAAGFPSAYSSVKYRWTLAAPPLPLSYGGAGEGRLKVSWDADGNVPGTRFVVEMSSDSFSTVTVSSLTLNAFAVFDGLVPGVACQARIKAVNGEDVPTPWAYMAAVTPPRPPAAPRHAADTGSSVSWAWDLGTGNPARTEYYAEDGLGSSGWTADAAAWTGGGWTPDTRVQLRVKARNSVGAESAAVATAAYTSIEAPAGVGFDMVGVTSVTARALGTFSNLGQGRSALRLDDVTAGSDSGWTASAAWTSGPLAPNTFHTFRARSRNGDAEEAAPAVRTLATGIRPPGASDLALAADSPSQLTLTAAPPPNPTLAATGCEFLFSEGPDGHGSGPLLGAYSYVHPGLSPDTRYGFRLRYYNADGVPGDPGPVGYRTTLAVQPPARPYSSVWDTELRADWSRAGNPDRTRYVAELSTDSFSTLVASSVTLNSYAVFSWLTPSTGYRARVKALNGEGAATAWTDLGPVTTLSSTPGEPTHLGEGLDSVTWIWPRGVNPPGTEFRASDETGDTGWVPDLTQWASAGKAVNTRYTLSVRSRNALGVETPPVSTSACTSIEPPTGLAFDMVGSSSVTVRAVPAFTRLDLDLSGASFSNDTLGSGAPGAGSGWVRSSSWTPTALSPNTSCFFSVLARNGDGDRTPRTESSPVWTALEPPSAPGLTAGSSVQISLTVAPPANPAAGGTGCEFEAVAGAGALGSGRLMGAYAFTDPGLSVNTRYGWRVRYFNGAGSPTDWSPAQYRWTLADRPAAQAWSGRSDVSLQANWGAGGNLAGTRYVVDLSTDSYATLVARPATTDAWASFAGLTPNTTYMARVAALNDEDAPTAATDLGRLATDARQPAAPSILEAGGQSVKAGWDAAGDPPGTLFELQLSTSQDFSPVRASSVTAAAWALLQGLSPQTTYYARVRTNGWGAFTGFVSAGSTVTLGDVSPPSGVTDLRAAPGTAEGTVRLSWTAPGDDGRSGTAARYVVKWSFSPIGSQDAFDSAYAYAQSWSPAAGGAPESRLLSGLTPGATYYVAVEAVDKAYNHGSLSNAAAAWAQWDTTPPSAASDLALAGVSNDRVRLRWTAPGDDGMVGRASEYDLRYSPLGPLDTLAKFLAAARAAVPAPSPSGTLEDATILGLADSTTYWFAVRTADDRPNWSALSPAVKAVTVNSAAPLAPAWPAQPVGIAGSVMTLDWLDNSESDLAGYRVLRSTTAGGPYAQAAAPGADQSWFTDPGFVRGTTYYYVVAAVDRGGLQSPLSSEVAAYAADVSAPEAPPGLRAWLLDDGRYRLEWSPPSRDGDASALTDLAAYRVYRSVGPDGAPALAATLSSSTLAWTEAAPAGPAYFRVRAADASGNESPDSLVAAPDLSVIAESADKAARLTMTRSASAVLYRDGNAFGEDLSVGIERRPSDETGAVLKAYDVTVRTAGSRQAADSALASVRSRPELSVKVPGLGVSAAGAAAGGVLGASHAPRTAGSGAAPAAALFWFDGAEWIKLGGELDRASGLVAVQTTRTGRFQVRRSLRSEGLALMEVVPRKIFTPNGDGVNDFVEFFFDNPSDSVISQAKVYDLTGAEVSDMKRGTTGTSYIWDGRDSSGRVVSAGIYIYQFQAEGKTMNGTVVVAR